MKKGSQNNNEKNSTKENIIEIPIEEDISSDLEDANIIDNTFEQ